jgi:hypothetical protein
LAFRSFIPQTAGYFWFLFRKFWNGKFCIQILSTNCSNDALASWSPRGFESFYARLNPTTTDIRRAEYIITNANIRIALSALAPGNLSIFMTTENEQQDHIMQPPS